MCFLIIFLVLMLKRKSYILYGYYSTLFYKYMVFNRTVFFYNIFSINLLLLKYFFLICNDQNVFYCSFKNFFDGKNTVQYYNKVLCNSIFISNIKKFLFIKKYFIIGLGYEVFIYKNYFFLNLGYSHYIKVRLFPDLRLYCKKKRFYLLSSDKLQFNNFLSIIYRSHDFNIYKVKGLMWFKFAKSIKNKICMKQGKKKYR